MQTDSLSIFDGEIVLSQIFSSFLTIWLDSGLAASENLEFHGIFSHLVVAEFISEASFLYS
jgi:hypothetical protein